MGSRRTRQRKRSALPVEVEPTERICDVPSSWAWTRLGLIAAISGGVTKGRKLAGRETLHLPYLRVANVQRWKLELEVMKEIEIPADELETYIPDERVREAGMTGASTDDHNPTDDDMSPETLIDEDGARSAREQGEGGPADFDLSIVDEDDIGGGDGLDEDAAATRLVASSIKEGLIAASCSKNFGVYRERTGILMAISEDASLTPLVQQNLNFLNRQNYSFPPDHGARLVTMVLTDPALRNVWEGELAAMRTRMLSLRQSLSNAMRVRTNSDRFDFVADHRGMFSLIGATPEHVAQLRDEFAIYIVGDGRLNIAGLREERMDEVADAFATIGI